jgi:hypothetical protein
MDAWKEKANTSVLPGFVGHFADMQIVDLDSAAFMQNAPSQSHNKFIRSVVNVAKALDPSPDVTLEGTIMAYDRAMRGDTDKDPKYVAGSQRNYGAYEIERTIANQVKHDMGPDKIRQVTEQCAEFQDKHDHVTFLDFSSPDSKPLVREYYNRISQATMDYINQHPVPPASP